jgi:acetyl-CoA acetyltransferase
MNEVVIIDAVRSPISRHSSALSSVRPDDLLADVLKALMERTGVDPALVEDVYAGCGNQAGEDNRDVARMSALLAGFPQEVSGDGQSQLLVGPGGREPGCQVDCHRRGGRVHRRWSRVHE